MIRHIVMVKFKPEATDEERATMRATVERFRDEIPEVRALVCGQNIGSGPNHHDFALVADFDDIDAFRRYIASPQHRAYVEGPARAVASIAAIQHEF